MSSVFWIVTLIVCAVLAGIWIASHEDEHNRQRKLRRIRKRLEQIEEAKNNEGSNGDD
ncbi:MAG: hypothetical protein PVG24_09745 [Gammaproteobacteria bacterium]